MHTQHGQLMETNQLLDHGNQSKKVLFDSEMEHILAFDVGGYCTEH
jgi:hypothetical protein